MNRFLMGIGLVLLLTAFAGAAPLAFAGFVLVVIAVEREAKRIREEARRALEEAREEEDALEEEAQEQIGTPRP